MHSYSGIQLASAIAGTVEYIPPILHISGLKMCSLRRRYRIYTYDEIYGWEGGGASPFTSGYYPEPVYGMEAAKDLLRRAVDLESARKFSEALICYEEGIQNLLRVMEGEWKCRKLGIINTHTNSLASQPLA